jgi:hypothetical protein
MQVICVGLHHIFANALPPSLLLTSLVSVVLVKVKVSMWQTYNGANVTVLKEKVMVDLICY